MFYTYVYKRLCIERNTQGITQKHLVCLFSDREEKGREGWRMLAREYAYVCARHTTHDGRAGDTLAQRQRFSAAARRSCPTTSFVACLPSAAVACRVRSAAYALGAPRRPRGTLGAVTFDSRSRARLSRSTSRAYVFASRFVRVALRDKASSNVVRNNNKQVVSS